MSRQSVLPPPAAPPYITSRTSAASRKSACFPVGLWGMYGLFSTVWWNRSMCGTSEDGDGKGGEGGTVGLDGGSVMGHLHVDGLAVWSAVLHLFGKHSQMLADGLSCRDAGGMAGALALAQGLDTQTFEHPVVRQLRPADEVFSSGGDGCLNPRGC